jgi:hypothetical protein
MKNECPGILPVRSLNEYRRRDMFAYLGLRYYLDNQASRSDLWAQEVATNLVLNRTDLPYFPAFHFKDANDQGRVEHRSISLPCPSEALAEAALLEECARRPDAFSSPPVVFSYWLNKEGSRSGIFQPYIRGLRDRHEQIAQACEDCPNGVVRYADIKRFYPSVTLQLAIKTWGEHCDIGPVPGRLREVGKKLINDQASAAAQKNEGILTGPAFSHLLGNLVLWKIDNDLLAAPSVKYFRYVDDIVFVGEREAVRRSVVILRCKLQDLGFELHGDDSPKSIEVSTRDWLEGRDDFSDGEHRNWPSLVEDLRLFLLLNPKQSEALQSALRNESFRMPLRDYSAAVHEWTFLERTVRKVKWGWFRSRAQGLTIEALVNRAKPLRDRYERELHAQMDGASDLSGFERKRRIPKLRYLARRLIYLAEDATLLDLASAAGAIQELHLDSQVMKAVATGMIDDLLPLGTNAAQAAAQALLAAGKVCSISKNVDAEVKVQALATFLFNGVRLALSDTSSIAQSELVRFATSGSDMNLMRSADPYIREIACLHGLSREPRHAELLRKAFDEDEELFVDAVEQLQQSASP